MIENKKHTLEIFEKLKGQHVLINREVLRFIGIAVDKYDFLYLMWDGRKLSYYTILDRMSQLKDKIDNEHYQDFIRTAKLNDNDSDGKWSPKTDEEILFAEKESKMFKLITENKIKSDNINDEHFELLSEICWDLN